MDRKNNDGIEDRLPKTVVLLSSFNGEKYITEQLHSILAQLPPDGSILIRDDGSSDKTVEKITAISDPRIFIIKGKNVGFSCSFFELMRLAPNDAQMIMLSDQDDFWLPNKIKRAWAWLKTQENRPALYSSRLMLVNENLQELEASILWPRPPSFENALTENIVTGCTATLNRKALELVIQCKNPLKIYFHDWWLYLVISAFGKVKFDSEPTILYRQHNDNVIGMGAGFRRYINILKFLSKQSWTAIMYEQIAVFVETYGNLLTLEQRVIIKKYLHPSTTFSRIRLFSSSHRFRQFPTGEIALRLLCILRI
jgi:glycosyltransferase involved in cell wall biosynthesis